MEFFLPLDKGELAVISTVSSFCEKLRLEGIIEMR